MTALAKFRCEECGLTVTRPRFRDGLPRCLSCERELVWLHDVDADLAEPATA